MWLLSVVLTVEYASYLSSCVIYWSPRLARSHYCQQLTLSVSLSVCLSVTPLQIFFVSRWNRAIFWPSVLHVALYKTDFFDFWFRPLTPKICTKLPISRLVWQIDRRCLVLLGGFRGWPIQRNHAKCCGTDPCCHGNEICTKLPISQLVWQIDQRCLGLPGGFWGWPIQRNHAKCCGTDPYCQGNEISAMHGDPVAYRLVFVYLII